MQLWYAESPFFDPWYNLAYEEYLLETCPGDSVILYLWQNQNTVVIGRNQNAWKECRSALLEREGGKLARRSSGGGAVFHDLGNLNFTFIAGKDLYDVETQLGVILGALRMLGIEAEFSGRNDLIWQDKKFSGNAFCHRKHASLHHGTLMVEVDYDKLTRYLSVSKDKIRSKGIESVRSRVVNLKEIRPDLTVPMLKEAIRAAFESVYGGKTRRLPAPEEEKIAPLRERYASWQWRFGESPAFDVTFSHRFPWGGAEICLAAREGRVTDCRIYSDAMDEAEIARLAARLPGVPLRGEDLGAALGQESAIARDLAELLRNKAF